LFPTVYWISIIITFRQKQSGDNNKDDNQHAAAAIRLVAVENVHLARNNVALVYALFLQQCKKKSAIWFHGAFLAMTRAADLCQRRHQEINDLKQHSSSLDDLRTMPNVQYLNAFHHEEQVKREVGFVAALCTDSTVLSQIYPWNGFTHHIPNPVLFLQVDDMTGEKGIDSQKPSLLSDRGVSNE
jgi:hypothetical protein